MTGTVLDNALVAKACEEEMAWVSKQNLWDVVSEVECFAETGRESITMKWVDRNKGDNDRPVYRSRLMVREVRKAVGALPEHESFSAMPPLETLKTLCSLMVSKKVSKPYNDISRANFYGLAKRKVYCTIPAGQDLPGKCARLRKSMYGTLDAASIWQDTSFELLRECDIRQGVGWPALFYHEGHDLRFLVHGDFLALGDQQALEFLEGKLKEKFEYRVDGLSGPEPNDGVSMSVLNRVLEYDKQSGVLTYEPDPRHAQHLVKALGLQDCRTVVTAAEKQKLEDVLGAETLPPLEEAQASQYRSLTMRAA